MNRNLVRLTAALAVATASVVVLNACVAPPGRSGATADPVTLRVVSGNSPGGIGWDVTQAIIKTPSSSGVGFTDGASAVPVQGNDVDGVALAAVRGGNADIGVIRLGRLVTAGAFSLAVLEAPMVITNDEQATAVAEDTVATEAMGGLRKLGLVGLALAPGGLRHFIGEKTAIRSPTDVAGTVMNVRVDAGAEAIVKALGASVDQSVGADRTQGMQSGRIRGTELSMNQADSAELPAVVTSNLAPYEKFDVVVVRKKAWDALSAGQRTTLRQRTTIAADEAVLARPSEEQAMAAWCARPGGASIVLSSAEIDRFRAALEPVVADLERAAGAKQAIARMRALHEGTEDPTGRTCSGAAKSPTDAEVTVKASGDQSVLDGTWRTRVTPADFAAAGVTVEDSGSNEGVWTFHIAGGLASVQQPHGADCLMQFRFAGDHVSVDQQANGNDNCTGRWAGTYTRTGNAVTFRIAKEVESPIAVDRVIFGTWTRIGDG